MNPYLRYTPGVLIQLYQMPKTSREYRAARRRLDDVADGWLCQAISKSAPGDPLYRLRKTMHPRLQFFTTLVAIMWFLCVIFIIIVQGLLPESLVLNIFLLMIVGVPILLFPPLLIIRRDIRPRKAFLASQFEAANRAIDALKEDERRHIFHFIEFENPVPGAMCGCIDCRCRFTLPDTFEIAEEDPECPECHGSHIAYDSPTHPLTPESLAELHDFVSKE